MNEPRTDRARHMASRVPDGLSAPRAAALCRPGSPPNTRFAPLRWVLAGILPAAVLAWILLLSAAPAAGAPSGDNPDRDGNGVEDLLDRWLAGQADWQSVRAAARGAAAQPDEAPAAVAALKADGGGSWASDRLRILRLGGAEKSADDALDRARAAGHCEVLHRIERFGGVEVLDLDATALAAYLAAAPGGEVWLDRSGVPALFESRNLIGADEAADGFWSVGEDWTTSVAILDSGCDTAHGDLGDGDDDDNDGPAPAVGDAQDWWPAQNGWPTSSAYQVVGWHDVTDDFPAAQGPWDYHYHGTALASVTAGSGVLDPDLAGIAPGTRLTIIKYYDFDEIWHMRAGDFLAACDWLLENRELYRVRIALMAVNWPVDSGISAAMEALLEAGIVPVAAMGNTGPEPTDPGYPAALETVLTVGAVDDDGAVAAYSGRGPASLLKPDLVAPGGGLLPERGRITAADNEPNDSYSDRFGTSLAAAHVAGALALLDEALRKSGLDPGADRAGALLRRSLLLATCRPVTQVESSDGASLVELPFEPGPDAIRGYGLARIDAAIEAALQPLRPGVSQLDYILSGWDRPVIARRLVLQPGVNYLIEASPVGALDISLEIVDPTWMQREDPAQRTLRCDSFGPGVSEFMYLTPEREQALFLVVKSVSGAGSVHLEARATGIYPYVADDFRLPGKLTAPPNHGLVGAQLEPVIAVSSQVAVELQARALNVIDAFGVSLDEFPVFVFPHPSAQGGFTQPLLMDLDGSPGDEIVVGSGYGSLYFFDASGEYDVAELDFNVPLSTPVGWINSAGTPVVATISRTGTLHAYSNGPTLEWSRELDHSFPLPPAVGQLIGPPSEELVVAFEDGTLLALTELGFPAPGWPISLGGTPVAPPVTCDLDEDGFQEIVVACRETVGGAVTLRVLHGTGLPGPGDGEILPAVGGGDWHRISSPAVLGRYGTGELRIALAGLTDNGLTGDEDRWALTLGQLYADGSTGSLELRDFSVRAATDVGQLAVDAGLVAVPLAWNDRGGTGTEPHVLAHLRWREVLNGLTDVPGGATLWLSDEAALPALAGRQELLAAGPQTEAFTALGAVLVPVEEDLLLRVSVLEDEGLIMPVHALGGDRPCWTGERGDSRNSGSYPLRTIESAASTRPSSLGALRAWPNPGNGRFRFAWDGAAGAQVLGWEIFDLRGRLIRRLEADGEGGAAWDTLDGKGRPAATGTYFVRARSREAERVTRILLQR